MTTNVIQLADLADETIAITELASDDGTFVGKRIERDGSITPYPKVTWWRQRVAQVPANVAALLVYLREARMRNVCLIRAAPANLSRQRTRRQNAFVPDRFGNDRGDHGFIDEPSKLLFLDVDGARINWRADPEGAVRRIVGRLGEPWGSTSFVWFFSATHGLERDEQKRWTGAISDGDVRVRLAFITQRALNWGEADALTKIAKAHSGLPLDEAISRLVQPNYIQRIHWSEHPDRDALGDIPTIGRVKGVHEYLGVPDELAHKMRWAKAQGHSGLIANHPDATSAVRGIGSDGRVRQHLAAAVQHLLRANPPPDHVMFVEHAITITQKLQSMVAGHEPEISSNLAAHGRSWSDVQQYLPDNISDLALWMPLRGTVKHRRAREGGSRKHAATMRSLP